MADVDLDVLGDWLCGAFQKVVAWESLIGWFTCVNFVYQI